MAMDLLLARDSHGEEAPQGFRMLIFRRSIYYVMAPFVASGLLSACTLLLGSQGRSNLGTLLFAGALGGGAVWQFFAPIVSFVLMFLPRRRPRARII